MTFKDLYIKEVLTDDSEETTKEIEAKMNKLMRALKVENDIEIKLLTYEVNKKRLENIKIYFRMFDNNFKEKLNQVKTYVNRNIDNRPPYLRYRTR